MKKGDREKVQELILQAIREWHELSTDVSLTSYIAEWLLQNDLAFVVRCKDCKFYKDSPMGGKGCHTHFNGRTEFIPKNDNDFCSYGGKKIDEQKDC